MHRTGSWRTSETSSVPREQLRRTLARDLAEIKAVLPDLPATFLPGRQGLSVGLWRPKPWGFRLNALFWSRLARRAVRLLAEAAGALLAAGRRSEAESLLDRRADAWAEAARLSAGARAQLRLLFRLAREGRLEAARTARMVKELRG